MRVLEPIPRAIDRIFSVQSPWAFCLSNFEINLSRVELVFDAAALECVLI
ncbi:hypothetical protein AXFE_12740 [Acidithrix ferrooxidans]|uniref:Uncharacterized protein n=1 Tax=Acidithrix ferrooxidans TaxID=1280514 RepID=A0A0D8HJ12_9ACTN|nr:hypothetical protein AXFE_12740 [Acidithrix ferrooxidans]CAG4928112.1 unnamed protein product [Acidithrix sp. C25]